MIDRCADNSNGFLAPQLWLANVSAPKTEGGYKFACLPKWPGWHFKIAHTYSMTVEARRTPLWGLYGIRECYESANGPQRADKWLEAPEIACCYTSMKVL